MTEKMHELQHMMDYWQSERRVATRMLEVCQRNIELVSTKMAEEALIGMDKTYSPWDLSLQSPPRKLWERILDQVTGSVRKGP